MKKEYNKVIGKLVSTYDLSPSGAKDVKSINYLYVYEYEYDGKKYNYSVHKQDSFDSVIEEIELYFDKDPSKVFILNDKNNTETDKKGKLITAIFIVVAFVIFIYLLVMSFKSFIKNPVITILLLLLFIVGIIISKIKAKKHKDINQLLADALLENRFATAHLKKNTFLLHELGSNEYYNKMTQYNQYKAKYEYEYNGKKYKATLYFSEIPPQEIKVFFKKNPRNIFYYTK